MYHAVIKDLDEYNGGTDLMRNIGIYIQRKPKKYTVIVTLVKCFKINRFPLFQIYISYKYDLLLQKIIKAYYEDYSFDEMVNHFMDAKETGDEFTLLLASKWLRRNITVVTSKKDWSVYPNCRPDIVVTYKGKDRFLRGKWGSSQLTNRSSQPGKKSSREYHYSLSFYVWPFTYR